MNYQSESQKYDIHEERDESNLDVDYDKDLNRIQEIKDY